MKKALIAMSGGVDSSVAAFLTKDAGYDCVGCTMRLFDGYDNFDESDDDTVSACCLLDDVEDARSVARRLSMPFYAFNYKKSFKTCVMDKFACDYRDGLTPNPCLDCNKYLKFGELLRRAKELSCDKLVTGHYALIEETDDGFCLKKAADRAKDQSYVLYTLDQDKLSHLLFPLGKLTKGEVRAIALANGLVTAAKKESQDICFVPDGNYAKALEKITGQGEQIGDFVDKCGKILGKHKGISHYTVGQHKGLGLVTPEPLYVASISPADRRITLCTNDELFRREFSVTDLSFVSGDAPGATFSASVKIRYRHRESPATVTMVGDSHAGVVFDNPERAITPGQAAVFYDGDRVIGGGRIERG